MTVVRRRARTIIATPAPTLRLVFDTLIGLRIGQGLEVSAEELQAIGPLSRDGCLWTAVDRIMGGRVEFAFLILPSDPHPETGSMTFTRADYLRDKGDLRTWIAPDKRINCLKRSDGYWEGRPLRNGWRGA